MATNITRQLGEQLAVTVTHPTVPVSGGPCRWGTKVGIAEIDEDATDGKTTVKFNGCATIPVKGINAGGNTAIAEGDPLYYTDADTPPVSAKATGTYAGNAMAAVASGATATIEIRLAG